MNSTQKYSQAAMINVMINTAEYVVLRQKHLNFTTPGISAIRVNLVFCIMCLKKCIMCLNFSAKTSKKISSNIFGGMGFSK